MNSTNNIKKTKRRTITKIEHPFKNRNKNINNQQTNQNKKFQNIQLKLTAISPIHIGSGKVYEPTNFVIDNNNLYEFREEDFFEKLPDIKQEAFLNIINQNSSDSFVLINKFVKENISFAKEVAFKKVPVTKGVKEEYSKRVGNISQIEGDNKKVFNEFLIQKTQTKQLKSNNNYKYAGYIPGSSLKGAISTGYQEYISKQYGEYKRKELFQSQGRAISKNIFKDFKVADSKILKSNIKIGFALNKERFEYDFDSEANNIKLSTYIEVICPSSEFLVDISYRNLDLITILNSCNNHYLPIFKTILANNSNGKEEFISKYLENDFYEKFKDFMPDKNQYLIRLGKYSGARAVTIEGKRKIEVKESRFKTLQNQKEETTTWLFGDNPSENKNLVPFGWILIEINTKIKKEQ